MCHDHTFDWSQYVRVTGGDPGHLEMTFLVMLSSTATLLVIFMVACI